MDIAILIVYLIVLYDVLQTLLKTLTTAKLTFSNQKILPSDLERGIFANYSSKKRLNYQC